MRNCYQLSAISHQLSAISQLLSANALDTLLIAETLDKSAGRMVRDERDPHHAATPPFHVLSPDDLGFFVVGAFDEYVWLERADQLQRRILIEHDNAVHARERGQHTRAFDRRDERAIGPLVESAHRGIAVHAHDERAAQGARLLEQRHMPDVKQIENPIGEYDGTGLGSAPTDRIFQRADAQSGSVALGWNRNVWLNSGRWTDSL